MRRLILAALCLGGLAYAAQPQKTIFAHFYYWYPINADICTHHPPKNHFDRNDVNWWMGEFANAAYAGVDVLTLMYWDVHDYNPAALEVMLKALHIMDAQGKPHPQIAMHLDGIEHSANVLGEWPVNTCDLTDPESQNGVLRAFVNFFRFFAEHDALDLCYRHDGRLVAFVYRPEYGRVHALADNSMIDTWHDGFRKQLGEELYVVLESAYYNVDHPNTNTHLHCTNADSYYRWDAALHGPLLEKRGEFPIATIGPGFDPRGQGGPHPRIRHRNQGDKFRADFGRALEWDPPWLVIETFNFFEEGTDITETREFGRLYLDIAHTYSEHFKSSSEADPDPPAN